MDEGKDSKDIKAEVNDILKSLEAELQTAKQNREFLSRQNLELFRENLALKEQLQAIIHEKDKLQDAFESDTEKTEQTDTSEGDESDEKKVD